VATTVLPLREEKSPQTEGCRHEGGSEIWKQIQQLKRAASNTGLSVGVLSQVTPEIYSAKPIP
jgi:hypothetical protein